MTDLTPSSAFDNVYQLETDDLALAGTSPSQVMNRQAQSLLNRTEFLYEETQGLQGQSLLILGDYAAGLEFTAKNQAFRYLEDLYTPQDSLVLPYTTSGAGSSEIALFHSLGDVDLRGNLADPDEGAQIVARSSVTVLDILDLLSISTDPGQTVIVRSYHADSDVGGGEFYWDAAKLKSLHNGGTIVSPTVPWDGTFVALPAFLLGTGETSPGGSGCWVRRYDHDIQVSWFGSVVNDAAKDNSDVFEAAKKAVVAKSAPNMPALVLPTGEMYYSVSPNFGEVNGFRIVGGGADGCVLKYTGFARAVNFDPSAYDLAFRYGMSAEGFLIDAGPSAAASLYLENIAHSRFQEVFAINGSAACIHFDLRLAVLCNFDTCGSTVNRWAITSVHAETWRLTTSPSKLQATTACTFINCIGEGASLAGWRLLQCTACKWDGGTAESNSGRGVLITNTCRSNKFDAFSMEANATADVRDDGQLTKWTGGYAVSDGGFEWGNTSLGVTVEGMFTNTINIISGAQGAVLKNVDYNHKGTGTYTDNGTDTVVVNLRNRTTGLYEYKTKPRVALTVGASPFTYTNTTGRYQLILTSGGTVSSIAYARPGSSTAVTGQVGGAILVAPGDGLVVTYLALPTMNRIPFGNLAI